MFIYRVDLKKLVIIFLQTYLKTTYFCLKFLICDVLFFMKQYETKMYVIKIAYITNQIQIRMIVDVT